MGLMMAKEKQAQDLELGEAAKGGKKKLIIIIAAAVLVLALGGGAAWWFLGRGEPPAEGEAAEHAEAPAEGEEGAPHTVYIPVPEAIIANLPSEKRSRTLKVTVVFATKSGEVEAKVMKHLPLLRSELSMLLAGTTADSLMTPEGQAAFRDQALLAVQGAMQREEQIPAIDRVLFTSFVMQ